MARLSKVRGQKPMQIVILAGGLATRLGPLTRSVPKSMLTVAGRPFLAHQLELFRAAGISDVVLCVAHLGEQIEGYFGDGRAFGLRIRYSYEGASLLGTGGALKAAEPLLADEFLLTYGDSYLLYPYANVLAKLRASNLPGLMVTYRNDDSLDASNAVVREGLVVAYGKAEKRPDMLYIDAGLLALRRDVLARLQAGQPAALDHDLLSRLAAERLLLSYPTRQRFYEIGSHSGLAEFRDVVERGALAA